MSDLKKKLTYYLRKSQSVFKASLYKIFNLAKGLHPQNFKKSNILELSKKEFYVSKLLFSKRVLQMTWQGIRRNKILSLATVFVLSLIVLVFNITFAVNYLSNQSIKQVSQKIDIIVWIKDSTSSFEIEAIKNDLQNLPETKEVVYTSKEKALTTFQVDNPEVYTFIKQYRLDNPLPASLGIVARNIEDNLKILDFIKQERYQEIINTDEIKNNTEERERTEKVISITRFIYQSGQYLVGLFFLVFVFITLNTVNMIINRRAREILIMRLVGAKYAFIRFPFILEGMFYAICAFSFGLILMYVFALQFKQKISAALLDDSLMSGFENAINLFLKHFYSILFYEILIAIVMGVVSSYLAIEWYLRKKNLLID